MSGDDGERPLRRGAPHVGGARQAQARYGAMPYNRALVPSFIYCDVQTVLHMEPFPIFYCCRGVGTILSGCRIITDAGIRAKPVGWEAMSKAAKKNWYKRQHGE